METINGNNKLDCLIITRVPAFEYNLKWRLEDYSRLKNDVNYTSSKFYPEVGCAWWLQLHKYETSMTLYLQRSEGNKGELQVECEISVTTGDGKVHRNKTMLVTFNNIKIQVTLLNQLQLGVSYVKTTGMDIVEITLLLKINKINASQQTSSLEFNIPTEIEFQNDIQKTMLDDLKKFYEIHLNTDVSLSIEGEILKVHQAILSARSPVFAKMFQQEMTETTKSNVVIEDIKMATMKEVVAFMYGKARRDYDYDTAVEIYYAADKYDIKKLKETCGVIIASHIKEENAGQILSFADKHGDKVLKETVMKFITFRMKSCVKTDWWNKFICNGNELAAELTAFIADFK